MKICSENTRFVITHITHNHAGTHEQVEKHFGNSGIEVAYDGMALSL